MISPLLTQGGTARDKEKHVEPHGPWQKVRDRQGVPSSLPLAPGLDIFCSRCNFHYFHGNHPLSGLKTGDFLTTPRLPIQAPEGSGKVLIHMQNSCDKSGAVQGGGSAWAPRFSSQPSSFPWFTVAKNPPSHPGMCLTPSQTRSWQRVRTGLSLRSLPIQTVPGFCEYQNISTQ